MSEVESSVALKITDGYIHTYGYGIFIDIIRKIRKGVNALAQPGDGIYAG